MITNKNDKNLIFVLFHINVKYTETFLIYDCLIANSFLLCPL